MSIILDMNIYDASLDLNKWNLSLNNSGNRYIPPTDTNAKLKYQLLLTVTNDLVCLTSDTIILKPNGYTKITDLNKGNFVITDDNRKVQIKEIYKSKFKSNKNTNPYIIPKNSIGPNYPPEEVKLSRGHLIKYHDKWILPKSAGIFKQDTSKDIIEYYHIQLENYEIDNLVINGGTIVESLSDKNSSEIYKKRCKKLFKFNNIKKIDL